ncbi:MAG: hypothetical protein D6689_11365 [Deltaproteobacteria bacterium]|nr:MAG: hypothetical protein D6689_11365 [Deltaproteobacteria bacterium]
MAPRAIALAAVAAALAACFDPDYPVGLPCGPDRFCPPGQQCSADNVCVAPASGDAGAAADAEPTADARDDGGLGRLLSIDIGPDVTLALGDTYTFTVTATYERGTRVEDNTRTIWRSSDNGVVFVDFMGVAKPQSPGTATVTADFEGRVDTADVTVTPAM